MRWTAMDTFPLLPIRADWMGVTWGSRALNQPPRLFEVLTSRCGASPGCGERWEESTAKPAERCWKYLRKCVLMVKLTGG